MKHTKKSAMTLLLMSVLLLSGCTEKEPAPAPGTDLITSADSSNDNSSADPESSASTSSEPESADFSQSTTSSEVTASSPATNSSPVYEVQVPEFDEPPYAVTTEIPWYILELEDYESTRIDDGFTFPAEFTEEDLKLQEFLKETVPKAEFLLSLFDWTCKAYQPFEGWFEVCYPQIKESDVYRSQSYYRVSSDYPQTIEELDMEFKKYIYSEYVDSFYLVAAAKVELTPNGDGKYMGTVARGDFFDDEGYLKFTPNLVEIDGVLYNSENNGHQQLRGYWDSAKIIHQTDDAIIFTYIAGEYADIIHQMGCLVYEDDVWKFLWFNRYSPF